MGKETINIGDTVYVKKGFSSAMGKGWGGIVEEVINGQAVIIGVYFDLESLTKDKDNSY